jgi:hypothetical protein
MCDIFNMQKDVKFLYTCAVNRLMMTKVYRNMCRGF